MHQVWPMGWPTPAMIEAAPDLLAVCEGMERAIVGHGHFAEVFIPMKAREDMKTAIAKAKGE